LLASEADNIGFVCCPSSLRAFMLLAGRQEGHLACKILSGVVHGAGVVVCLEQGADLHIVQLMPLHPKTLSSLASFKS